MKKYAILTFFAVCGLARGQAYDKNIVLGQLSWNSLTMDYDAVTNFLTPAASGGNGFVCYDATSTQFMTFPFGATLVKNAGTGVVDAVIASTDLTDASSAGRALLTGASASAQRSSLGLGTAATTASTAYATASQGALAATAVQPGVLATVATTGNYSDLSNKPSIPSALSSISFNHAPNRSTIVTTASAANGFQPSASKYSVVNYSVTISTTVSLSGNSTGYVVLEIASTNSTTASDWLEIGRTASGQSGTLVVGLTLNQTGGGQLGGLVPAGWYARLRSVTTSGTPTYSYNSGQEVQPPQ